MQSKTLWITFTLSTLLKIKSSQDSQTNPQDLTSTTKSLDSNLKTKDYTKKTQVFYFKKQSQTSSSITDLTMSLKNCLWKQRSAMNCKASIEICLQRLMLKDMKKLKLGLDDKIWLSEVLPSWSISLMILEIEEKLVYSWKMRSIDCWQMRLKCFDLKRIDYRRFGRVSLMIGSKKNLLWRKKLLLWDIQYLVWKHITTKPQKSETLK